MFKSGASSSQSVFLDESIAQGLANGFEISDRNFVLGSSRADLLIKEGEKIALVEIKTGDPNLPLPSSTSAQIKLLAEKARRAFEGQTVVPVIITNYKENPSQEAELKSAGVKVIRVLPGKSSIVVQDFAKAVGFTPRPAAKV